MIDDMGIFKYYSPQDYNFIAFCKNQIFFSRPSNLNDPFDATSIIISSYKKFCKDINWSTTGEKNLGKHAICSFSEGKQADNKHLWSLYAANYTGYAIEFDFEILSETLPRTYATPIYLQKVHYDSKPFNLDNYSNSFSINGESIVIDKIIRNLKDGNLQGGERLFQYLHLYKDKSIWGNEKEWRMIIGNLNNNSHLHCLNNGFLLDLPPTAIKAIIVGQYMTDDNKQMMKNCAIHKGIPIYEATPCIEKNRWAVKIKNCE